MRESDGMMDDKITADRYATSFLFFLFLFLFFPHSIVIAAHTSRSLLS